MNYGSGAYGAGSFGEGGHHMEETPFIRPRTMTRLRAMFRRGMQTVQDWNDDPVVTIERRGSSGFAPVPDLTDLTVISIKITNDKVAFTPLNQGAVEVMNRGELKAWHPVDIRVDDRFRWQGQVCRIVSAPPAKLDTVRVFEFELLEGQAP